MFIPSLGTCAREFTVKIQLSSGGTKGLDRTLQLVDSGSECVIKERVLQLMKKKLESAPNLHTNQQIGQNFQAALQKYIEGEVKSVQKAARAVIRIYSEKATLALHFYVETEPGRLLTALLDNPTLSDEEAAFLTRLAQHISLKIAHAQALLVGAQGNIEARSLVEVNILRFLFTTDKAASAESADRWWSQLEPQLSASQSASVLSLISLFCNRERSPFSSNELASVVRSLSTATDAYAYKEFLEGFLRLVKAIDIERYWQAFAHSQQKYLCLEEGDAPFVCPSASVSTSAAAGGSQQLDGAVIIASFFAKEPHFCKEVRGPVSAFDFSPEIGDQMGTLELWLKQDGLKIAELYAACFQKLTEKQRGRVELLSPDALLSLTTLQDVKIPITMRKQIDDLMRSHHSRAAQRGRENRRGRSRGGRKGPQGRGISRAAKRAEESAAPAASTFSSEDENVEEGEEAQTSAPAPVPLAPVTLDPGITFPDIFPPYHDRITRWFDAKRDPLTEDRKIYVHLPLGQRDAVYFRHNFAYALDEIAWRYGARYDREGEPAIALVVLAEHHAFQTRRPFLFTLTFAKRGGETYEIYHRTLVMKSQGELIDRYINQANYPPLVLQGRASIEPDLLSRPFSDGSYVQGVEDRRVVTIRDPKHDQPGRPCTLYAMIV
ncbi:MAG: hypothetical protein K940chlam7_00854 [Chlamydiae bacterium]|nr:hypothetical protein [Chlamydiota bacterium]